MLAAALSELAAGRPILLYDLDGRENETDMIVAGQFITPAHIARLRTEAGGLVCAAIPRRIAERLGLPYLRDVYRSSGFGTLRQLSFQEMPYGGLPAFSITINHLDSYTGITDYERSQTIRQLADLVEKVEREPSRDWSDAVAANFRSPGHVHILIGADLNGRKGHTELSLKLAELAGLTPVMVVCEMLDATTHRALSKTQAARYAESHGLAMVEARDLLDPEVVR